ncbi:MAG: tRNA 4-thiouridine(8) synthase ThiI [Candidatus Omnitrophica bacterium]|nr:tRNA 4-thiouridine(8) synthase ThiI [Candidatus Omnitrophota bacterium]
MKTIVMLSGGLDSSIVLALAAKNGLGPIAVHYNLPFGLYGDKENFRSSAKGITERLGVPLKEVFLGEDFIEMIKAPAHGRGKNFNPCIDCRIFNFRNAKKIMSDEGASFIMTGEVLGQRPMSQHKQALRMIEEGAGLEGLILRPLSARRLPVTIPEKEGWVGKELLLDIHGRGRKRQMELAEKLGVRDYPMPAGGCLMTDKGFSRRIKDLAGFKPDFSVEDASFLSIGRHFRISPVFKMVAGRNKGENEKLLEMARPGDIIFNIENVPGSLGVGRGEPKEEDIRLGAAIIGHYSDIDPDSEHPVLCKRHGDSGGERVTVVPASEKELSAVRI